MSLWNRISGSHFRSLVEVGSSHSALGRKKWRILDKIENKRKGARRVLGPLGPNQVTLGGGIKSFLKIDLEYRSR